MESMNLETAETISPLASRQRAHRSAVSNGTRLFCVDGLDGRSQTARRFRDLVEGMGNDLGGSDRLSEGQRQLIRRAATLSIMSESVEADFIRNLAFDSEAYGVLCDRLGRCLQRLGLERVSRDVTPSLQSYLQAKAARRDEGCSQKAPAGRPAPQACGCVRRLGQGREVASPGDPSADASLPGAGGPSVPWQAPSSGGC
jgi:hypothetical protein